MAAKAKKENSIIETIKTIVYALLIAGVFRTLFFQPFWIPSGSMKESLLIGDFLFVNKMAYGYSYASCPSLRLPSIGVDIDARDICGFLKGDNTRIMGREPARGDVVVFRHPGNGTDYIKRLVGLPGETVQMIDGRLHINGIALPQAEAGIFEEVFEPQGPFRMTPACGNAPVGMGGRCLKSRAIETMPEGRSYPVLDIRMQSSDRTAVFTVPQGHYFFMGDNRDNSTDSRQPLIAGGVGFVPFENLIGRADRVVISSAGTSMLAFWTWRSDRFFAKIP